MQLPAARPPQHRRPLERGVRLGEQRGIPARAVLLRQQHELAVDGARGLACAVEQQQREQPLRLRLARQRVRRRRARARSRRRRGRDPPRRRRPATRCASLYITDTTVSTMSRRSARSAALGDPQRNAGGSDLALGPHDALRDRRLGRQGRARDLRGREAADRPQRQRELRVGRERGMAASEQQREPLVGLVRSRGGRSRRARRAARACRGSASRGGAGRARCAGPPA